MRALALGLLCVTLGCTGSSDPGRSPAPAAAGGDECSESSAGQGNGGGSGADGTAGADPLSCTSGDTRCQGPTGYQQCTPDGEWGGPQSCQGYGEMNHCAVVSAGYDTPWAACVDPACWYWKSAGLTGQQGLVGVCLADGGFRACNDGGILEDASECAGGCVSVGEINGLSLGFCRPECEDGAAECLGGPLYRECSGGRWLRTAKRCESGTTCQPIGESALPRIACGDTCTPGTTRCAARSNGIEHCAEDGQFEAAEPCAIGVCQSKGLQAYCAPLCVEGAVDCAFDGAPSVRRCIEPGEWDAEDACPMGTTCRKSGGKSLGCVECIGPESPDGNAWAVADSKCEADAVLECSADNGWKAAVDCAQGETCVALTKGASSLAYCAVAAN